MSIFRDEPYIVEDEEVREELMKQCIAAGSQTAFLAAHGMKLSNFSREIRGRAPISRKLANALGYERILTYRKMKNE